MTKAQLIEALRALELKQGEHGAPLQHDERRGAPDTQTLRSLKADQLALEVQNRELRESQAAVEQSRSRYADLYDSAPVGYVTFDRKGYVLGANLTALRLFGLKELAIGSSFWTAVPVSSKSIFLEHLEDCAVSKSVSACVLTLRRTDGPRVLELRSTPFLDVNGVVTGFRTVLTDATAASRAEQMLRFLANVSVELATSLDCATTIATVVRAAVPLVADVCVADVRTPAGELKRVEVACAETLRTEVRHALLAADYGPGTPQALVMASGEPIMVSDASAHRSPTVEACGMPATAVIYAPMTARGRTVGVLTLVSLRAARQFDSRDLALARDVAHRAALAVDNAELYQLAQRAIRDREMILAVASHDLKNPLYAIRMTADTLLDYGASSPELLEQQLTLVKRSASQMERLIDDLLGLSTLQNGRLAITPSPLGLQSLAQDLRDTVNTAAQRKALTFVFELTTVDPTVEVDRERMQQVFANVLGNAVKFTPEGGTIAIGLQPMGDVVVFSVSDTGPGIPQHEVPQVFEAYWKGRDQTNKGGHGLGLYIARGIVEAHGGTIEVGPADGGGARFQFTLPAVYSSRAANGRPLHSAERPMVGEPHTNGHHEIAASAGIFALVTTASNMQYDHKATVKH